MIGRVLVTGAAGFVGRAVCVRLDALGISVRAAVRRLDQAPTAWRGSARIEPIETGDLNRSTDWNNALAGVTHVIHLAARVHHLDEGGRDSLEEYRAVNVAATLRLAQAAAAAGVRRFLFMSSVKVNGDSTPGAPFSEQDPPRPTDAYGISKLEAEQALLELGQTAGLKVTILRPPLVYGPGVGANFRHLMWLARAGWPLPFASIRNRRSLLYLGNLVSAIETCLSNPAAAGEIFLVADGEDVATPELVGRVSRLLGRPARLWPCPPALLAGLAGLAGRGAQARRLLSSLAVDSSKIRRMLDWRPPYSLDQGLEETARWFNSAWPS
jgi:UDP-N-acetyl-alpha-D-quinovosamine dehydrogenase